MAIKKASTGGGENPVTKILGVNDSKTCRKCMYNKKGYGRNQHLCRLTRMPIRPHWTACKQWGEDSRMPSDETVAKKREELGLT